jgi:hypothetical protein
MAIVWLEGLGKKKKKKKKTTTTTTSLGLEPMTFWLVAQCPN